VDAEMGVCGSYQDNQEELRDDEGDVVLMVVALNYEYRKGEELTADEDAKTMIRIAHRAGVQDISCISDKRGPGSPDFPTRHKVLEMMSRVVQRCKPGDWFVWFFAGHGVNVPDVHGDEMTGFDQAFVTPTEHGEITYPGLIIDDDFARALDYFVPQGVHILCINDCCHSGTICDIDSYAYTHEIYSISAAQDHEEAEDTGEGGALSTALRRAVRKLSARHGRNPFSIQQVFDQSTIYAERLTDEQELNLQYSGTDPDQMAWPMSFGWWRYLKRPTIRVNIHDYEKW